MEQRNEAYNTGQATPLGICMLPVTPLNLTLAQAPSSVCRHFLEMIETAMLEAA